HDVGLIVQVGCEPLYSVLPILREHRPNLHVVDLLFNDVGHVISHFLFERGIDAVIVESKYMADYVKRSTEIEDRKVHVVESGIEIDLYTPNKRALDRNCDLIVGYVGRMSKEKNPLGFIAFAEELLRRNRKVAFKLFGEGNQTTDVRERIAR